MARKGTTRAMSDKHEDYLARVLGGRKTRGSGNQPANQMDGRHASLIERFAFAWDGKSTLGKSISVTEEMWLKAEEQCHSERPMLALRWYNTERLDVGLDLVTIGLDDFVELRDAALDR